MGLGCFSQLMCPLEAVGITRLGIAVSSFCVMQGGEPACSRAPLPAAAATGEAQFQHWLRLFSEVGSPLSESLWDGVGVWGPSGLFTASGRLPRMCLRGLGMSAKEWGAEVEGVDGHSPCCCLEAQGTLERPEATPGICKPVDWGTAGPKIASACAGRRQPSDAAWGMFLLEWAS